MAEIGVPCPICQTPIVYIDFGDDYSFCCLNCMEELAFKKGFLAAQKEYDTTRKEG